MLRTGYSNLCRASPVVSLGRAGAHMRAVPKTRPAIIIDGSEYTKDPEYPPIQKTDYQSNILKKRVSWYEHIQDLSTVEEKQLAINLPRYYGYKCVMLSDDKFHYNSLPFIQHSTRTALKTTGLPEYYEPLRVQADKHVASIREDIESAIIFETIGYKPSNCIDDSPTEKLRCSSSRITKQINRVMVNALGADVDHLGQLEVDADPRHEAFWFVGGLSPPDSIRNKKKNSCWQKEYANDPVNRQFQYVGNPLLTLRHQHPLPVVRTEATQSAQEVLDVPQYKFDPRTVGYVHDYKHGSTIPGFWPGTKNEFGALNFLSRSHFALRNPAYGKEDDQNALHAQAILGSFAWLLGQACNQGFTIFNDLTYPLTTQTVITDGQHWSFYVYQMNTTQVHQDAITSNPKANLCWGTNEMKLYDHVNDDGTIVGFNDDVLRHLIQFYLNKPTERIHNMRPFLGTYEQKAADIEDTKRREFVESRYKHMVSNRPRHRLVPEVYNWEKIYKIDNKTLPLAPKRRFFELEVNPFQRRMDEHTPVYIPKAIRPGGPKSMPRWEKNYYP